ncbi:MdlB, ABC-type multidrug transport system, ATPase and permease component, partial [Pyrenophora tritici-repentis]
MDASVDARSPPRPAANAEAENAALAVQVLETKQEKDGVVEAVAHDDDGPAKSKSPQAGLKNYFRVFSYGTAFDFVLIALCSITSIGSGIAFPLMNVVFGQLVGSFTTYFIPGTTMTSREFQAEVNRLTLYLVCLFIAKFFLSYISMEFAMLFQSLTLVIGAYVVAFIKSPLLTLVASASLPFILVVYGALFPPFMRIHKITEKHHDDASAMAFEMFSSIRIIVAFGAEAKLARQHEDMLDKAAKNERKAAPLMGLMMSPMMVGQYGTFAIAFWFGIKRYSEGKEANVGMITVVLFSVMMALMNINRVVSPMIAITKAATAATVLFVTIDAPVPNTAGLKEPDITADADITFDNVCFSYPSRPDVQILKGLDLAFEAGKVTAIVGPSGSGKSTIVGLVQRWYDLSCMTALAVPATQISTSSSATEVTQEKKAEESKNKEEEPELGPNTCTGNIKIGSTDLSQ